MVKHPNQDLETDVHGTVRFVENKIVRYLLEEGSLNINDLSDRFAEDDEYRDDFVQFAQLIGFSVAGFGDLPYVREDEYHLAAKQAKFHKKSK